MKTHLHPTSQSFQTLFRNTLGPGLQFAGPSNAVLNSMLDTRAKSRVTG